MKRVAEHIRGVNDKFLRILLSVALACSLGGVAAIANTWSQQQALAQITYDVSVNKKQYKPNESVKIYVEITNNYNYDVSNAYAYYKMPVSGQIYQVQLNVSGTTWIGTIPLTSSMEQGTWEFQGLNAESNDQRDLFDNDVKTTEQANFELLDSTTQINRPVYKQGSAQVTPASATAGTQITFTTTFEGTTPADDTVYAYASSPTEVNSQRIKLTSSGDGNWSGTLSVKDDMEAGEWTYSAVQAGTNDGSIWTYNLSLEESAAPKFTITGTTGTTDAPKYVAGSAKAEYPVLVKRDQTVSLRVASDSVAADKVVVYYTKPVSGLQHSTELTYDEEKWTGTIPSDELNERGKWELTAVQMYAGDKESYVYDSTAQELTSGDFIVGTPFKVDEVTHDIDYKGVNVAPEPVVRDEDNQETILAKDSDYTVKYYSISYDEDNKKVRTEVSEAIDCGKYEADIEGINDYVGNLKTVEFEVVKVMPELNPEPKAQDVEYNGKQQALISAGVTTDGTIYYAQGTSAPSKEDKSAWSTEVPTNIDAGSYKVYYWVQGDKNHLDTEVIELEKEARIEKFDLKVSVKVDDKEYDGKTDASITIDPQAGVEGETLTFTGTTASFRDPNAADEVKVLLDTSKTVITVTGGQAKLDNYNVTYDEDSLKAKISPKKLTVEIPTSAVAPTKVYDGTTDATINEFEISGVNSEKLLVRGLSGVYIDKNVGDAKKVSVADMSAAKIEGLEGSVSTNYEITLTDTTLVANITKAPVTLVADNVERAFDEEDPELTATVTGLVNGEQFAKNTDYTLARAEGTAVGKYDINVTVVDTEMTKNYSITPTKGVFTILKTRAKVLTIPKALELTYNKNAQNLTDTGTADGGKLRYRTADEEPEGTAKFTDEIAQGTDAGTYNVYYYVQGDNDHSDSKIAGPVIVTIKSHDIADTEITATVTSKEVYDGTGKMPEPEVKWGDTVLVKDKDYTLSYSNNINAGSEAVVTITGIGNYTGKRDVKFTIDKKDATIKPDKAEKEYGAELPDFTATFEGLVNGDTMVKGTDYQLTTDATASSKIGTYKINATVVAGSTVAANYNFKCEEGTLEVIKVRAKTKVKPVAANVDYSGVEQSVLGVDGTTEEGTLYYMVSDTEPQTSDTGWTTTVPTKIDSGSYSVYYYIKGDSNHSDSYVIKCDSDAVINKKSVTVTPVITDRQYDGKTEAGFKLDNVNGVNGEVLSFTGGVATFNDKNAAESVGVTFDSSSVVVSVANGQKKAENYELVWNTDSLTAKISPAEVTIDVPSSAVASTKVYDGTVNAETSIFQEKTNIGDEVLQVSKFTANYDTKNVGENKPISFDFSHVYMEGIEGTLVANYKVTFKAESTTASITKAAAKIKPVATTKVYQATDLELTAELSGIMGGDTLTKDVDYTLKREEGEAVGEYTITATVNSTDTANNYDWTLETAKFSITKGSATVKTAPVAVSDLTYNKADQTLITAGVGEGGTIKYLVSSTEPETTRNFNGTLPTGKEARSYNVYYYVQGDGNHTDSEIFGPIENVKIAPRAVTDATITVDAIASSTYNGYAITPSVTVKYGDYELIQGTDYELTYDSNVDAGAAHANIKGIGNYGELRVQDFEITKKPVTLKVNDMSMEYKGTVPTFTATIDGLVEGQKLTEGTDYSISCSATSNSDVGTYDIVPTVVENTDVTKNYQINSENGTLTIKQGKAKIKTAPAAKTMTYNGLNQDIVDAGTSDDGTVMYAIAEAEPSIDSEVWSETVPQQIDAGSYSVYYYVKGDKNHTDSDVALVNGNSNINQMAIIVTPVISDKNYDATTNVEISIDKVQGANNEELVFSGAQATYRTANAGTDIAIAFDSSNIYVQVNGGQAKISNYAVIYNVNDLKGNINPKRVEIAVPQSAITSSKVYDSTTTAEISSFEAKTGVNDEKLLVENLKAAYEDKNVGYSKTVEVVDKDTAKYTGIEATLSSNYDIKLTWDNLKADITRANATIQPNMLGKEYGKDDPTLTATVTGLKGDDVFTAGTDYTLTRDAGETAGKYTIKAKVSETAATGNYNVTCNEGTFNILSVEAGVLEQPLAIAGLTYNKESQTLTTSGSAYGGTMMYRISSTTPESKQYFSEELATGIDEGEYGVYYYVKGDDSHTDSEIYGPVANNIIHPKNVTDEDITVANIADQTYTGSAIQPTTTVKYGDKELVQDEDYTLSYVNNVNVGEAVVTITGKGNYTFSREVAFKITPKDATITVVDAESEYLGELPKFIFATDGVVLGTDLKEFDDFNFVCEATSTSAVGTYTINLKTIDNSKTKNYNFTVVPGTLTIHDTKAKVETPATAKTLTYNSEAQQLVTAGTTADGTMMYAIATEAPSTSDKDKWSSELPTAIDAGTYSIYYYVKSDENHSDSDVYKVENPAQINKKEITVTPTADAKIYDGSRDVRVAIAEVNGEGSEKISFSNVQGRFDGKDASASVKVELVQSENIKITVTGGQMKAENYDVKYNTENLAAEIAKKNLEIEVPESSVVNNKEYDGTTSAKVNVFTVNTGVGDEKLKVDGLTAAYANKNVGTDKTITISNLTTATITGLEGSSSTDYFVTLTQPKLSGEITKKTVVLTAEDKSCEYGDAVPTLTATTEGEVTGETFLSGTDYILSCSATNLSLPGNYIITPSIVDNNKTSNYEVRIVRGVLAIEQGDTYTVRFDSNGGYGEADDQIIKRGTAEKLAANKFSRDGYRFIGWSYNRKATAAALTDQMAVTNLAARGSRVTLYAVWQDENIEPVKPEEGYTVKFNANGGEGTMADQLIAVGVTTSLAANVYTKEGYNFLGWSDEPSATAASLTDGQYVTSLAAAGQTKNLYAVWSQQEEPTPDKGYTVEYDNNGGQGTMANQVIARDVNTQLAKNMFTKDGYRFAGWSPSATATTPSLTNGQSVKNLAEAGKTIRLYAVWVERDVDPVDPTTNGYTIYFDANGGTGIMADQAVATDEDTALAANVYTRSGYTFIGWSTSADSASVSLADQAVVNHLAESGESITLYAVWRDNTKPAPEVNKSYTIHYNANGGKGSMSDQVVAADEDTQLATNVFKNDGYKFLGWSTDANAKVASLANEAIVNHLADAKTEITLYAVWQDDATPPVDPQTTFTVHFDANGGKGTMSDQTIATDTDTTLALNMFKKDGSTFQGWSTSKDASSASLTDGASVKNLTVTKGEITLYAVWRDSSLEPLNPGNPDDPSDPENEKATAYTIHFEPNGGVYEMADQVVGVNEKVHLSSNVFTRSGYKFIGWSIYSDATVPSLLDEATIQKLSYKATRITLYALWQEESAKPVDPETSYTVEFDGNGGNGSMSNQTVPRGERTKLAANMFTRDGYTFLGWSSDSSAATVSYTDEQEVYNLTSAKQSVKLYAVWGEVVSPVNPGNPDDPSDPENDKANAYTVRFDANNGEGTMADQVIACNTPTTLSRNAFTRDGYTFIGWSTDANASTASLNDRAVVTNLSKKGTRVVLYAIWRANDVTPIDPGNPDNPDDPDNVKATGYTVRFDANGGTGTMADQVIASGVSTKLAKNVLTREHYYFLGWAETSDATKAKYVDGASVKDLAEKAKRVTLYAVWTTTVPTIVVEPATVKDLTYNTTEQTLITPGSSTDGKMMYGVSTVEDPSTVREWSENVPTMESAGNYYVYEYVKGEGYFEDTDPKEVGEVTIAKAKTAVPVPNIGLEYNGKEQQGIEENDLYTIENDYETKAGTYTATLTLKDPDDYKWDTEAKAETSELASLSAATDSASITREWTIAKREININVGNATKDQNTGDPQFTATVENLVNNETLQAGVDYYLTRNEGENPGEYSITAVANDTEKMNNYSPTVNNGTLTIQAVQGASTTTANDTSSGGGILSQVGNVLTQTGDKVIIIICCVVAVIAASSCVLIISKRRKKDDKEKKC